MQIAYGNLKGTYFLQGAIDNFVKPLAEDIIKEIPGVSDVNIFYDELNDFYHCAFKAGGKSFDVRYYKVFSVSIDGKAGWSGCPRNLSWDFVRYLKQQAAQ